MKTKKGTGKLVRIISTDGHPNWPIIGYIETRDVPLIWKSDGKFDMTHKSEYDLIQVPVKHTLDVWLNIYPSGASYNYETKEIADSRAAQRRIACLHIVREYTEGEGL